MLDAVRAEHFSALTGEVCRIEPEGGDAFLATIERVRLHPGTQLPGGSAEKREPFSVLLISTDNPGFVDGADLSKAYYQIMFN